MIWRRYNLSGAKIVNQRDQKRKGKNALGPSKALKPGLIQLRSQGNATVG
jgi:hypothetical protein